LDEVREAQGAARAAPLAASALPADDDARACAAVCPADIPLDAAIARLRALIGDATR
jgi:hypothetical protein